MMVKRDCRAFGASGLLALRGVYGMFALVLAMAVLATGARAELRIDITRGVSEPIPIAVSEFHGVRTEEVDLGVDIADVISNNLERSGLFDPLGRSSFLQDPEALQSQPRFEDWRLLDAQALVAGSVETLDEGRVRVDFRLWDIFGESQMVGRSFETQRANWRRIAHIISDAIYQRITGEEGYFDTRVVYVDESGPADDRVKRLAIMDQDGANHEYLTGGDSLVLTPRFSPTTQEITYLAYTDNRPRVYLYNIETGRREVLGDFPGMTFAPRFSPDGNRVIMSLASGGNSDIYTMDLRTREVQQLTNSAAIDTSPSYSPDGDRIVFESDRGGTQQLYVMNANGSDVRRITFGDGRYATPVWSPRGDLIAFTRIHQGNFYIGVIRPDGTGERQLVQSYHAEGPTWAPNGRVLMFFKEERGSSGRTARLHSVDLTGFNQRQVQTPRDASDPAWSPLIP